MLTSVRKAVKTTLKKEIKVFNKGLKDIKNKIKLLKESVEGPGQGEPSPDPATKEIKEKVEAVKTQLSSVSKRLHGLTQKVESLQSSQETKLSASLQNQREISESVVSRTTRIENRLQGLQESLPKVCPPQNPKIDSVLRKLDQVQASLELIKTKTPASTFELNERLFSLNLKTEVVRDHAAEAQIGRGSRTFTAIKNSNSYIIASYRKGFVLYENGQKKHEERFRVSFGSVFDVIYVKHTDSYYFLLGGTLYRKYIDDRSPEPWINGGFGTNDAFPILYSEKLERIITVKGNTQLAIIDPHQKRIEFLLTFSFATTIYGLTSFGQDGEYIAFHTRNRHVGIFKYDKNAKKGKVISLTKYAPIHNLEFGKSIAIDFRNRVLMICTFHDGNDRAQSLRVFEYWNNILTLKASLDISDISHFIFNKGLKFYKSFDNFATFVAIDSEKNGGHLHIFRYDYHKKVIIRDVEKRLPSQEKFSRNLHQLGCWFYYTGSEGKLMRMTLVNQVNK